MKLISSSTPFMSSHPAVVVRVFLYALGAALLGGLLGWGMTTPFHGPLATIVFTALGVFITLRHPLEGLLLALALLPFEDFFYLNIELGTGFPNTNLSRIVIALVFAIVLARKATGRLPERRFTAVDGAMALALIALGLSTLRGFSVMSSLQLFIDRIAAPFMIYYSLAHLVDKRTALERVLWVVILIAFYNAVYGIYTQITGDILFVKDGVLTGKRYYSENLLIMRGLLDSPHVFGLVFALGVPAAFYLLLKEQRLGRRILVTMMLVTILVGLFLTYKRGAWIATLGNFAVLQFFFPRFRRLFLVLMVVTLGLMWLYRGEIEDSAVVNERINSKVSTLEGRQEIWNEALQAWSEDPVWGKGPRQYQAHSRKGIIESHYLDILVGTGLIGFVPYILVFASLAITGLRLYYARGPNSFVEPDLVAVFLATLVAYLISLYSVVMNHPLPHYILFLLAGAIVGAQADRMTPSSLPKMASAEPQMKTM
jgi:O-antigen ligase